MADPGDEPPPLGRRAAGATPPPVPIPIGRAPPAGGTDLHRTSLPVSGAGASKLFRGVDRAVFAAALTDRLRADGLSVSMPGAERLAASLAAVPGLTTGELYWLCRLSLVGDVGEVERFDRAFAHLFGTTTVRPPVAAGAVEGAPVDRGDRLAKVRTLVDGQPVNGAGLPWQQRAPSVGPGEDEEDGDQTTLPELVASGQATLATTPFDRLDPDELARVADHLEELAVRWATRPSRRHRAGSGPTLDLRRTLASARRTGGEPVVLHRRRRIRRPRPMVALLDVSGSMESYARVYLHLLRVLARERRAEVLAFATSLTRVTPVLRHRSADEAMSLADEAVGDRFGGTRIATALNRLLTHPHWATTVRGAVVLVVSDGWDTDPADLLARRMAALQRRAFRVVWVNPRAGTEGFAAEVAGMAAALPHCDRFLPGHHLQALEEVLLALSDHPPPANDRA